MHRTAQSAIPADNGEQVSLSSHLVRSAGIETCVNPAAPRFQGGFQRQLPRRKSVLQGKSCRHYASTAVLFDVTFHAPATPIHGAAAAWINNKPLVPGFGGHLIITPWRRRPIPKGGVSQSISVKPSLGWLENRNSDPGSRLKLARTESHNQDRKSPNADEPVLGRYISHTITIVNQCPSLLPVKYLSLTSNNGQPAKTHRRTPVRETHRAFRRVP